METTPIRQPWLTPEIYDLNGRETYQNPASYPNPDESFDHTINSRSTFFGPTS